MKLSDFTYDLPPDLIAQYPLEKRDEARLLVVDKTKGAIGHDRFCNVGQYLPPRSLIVINNSRVIPARLFGKREATGGRVEIFLLKQQDDHHFEALVSPLWKIKPDEKIIVTPEIFAQVTDKERRIVYFNVPNVIAYLETIGHIPLPPYIRRADEDLDREMYQTVYARKDGSVASPTAGLHFTDGLMGQLQAAGHTFAEVTLHVNYGTFKPVIVEDVTQHRMHEEAYEVGSEVWQQIRQARAEGRKTIAVGTTSCRVLETLAQRHAAQGMTDIFITPGYSFQMTDGLITNFHLPMSTLLMLVYAFGSPELMRRAYREAIEQKYRFYSYGDAMIVV